MGLTDRLYAHLPVWAQHASVSAYGLYWYWLRFGPGYSRLVNAYLRREQYSYEEWQRWQQEAVRTLLRLAAEQVPYYRQTWTTKQKEAAYAGRLADLPLLEKDPIRAQPTAFLRDDMRPWPRLTFHTSGTTGTPIASIWTAAEFRNSIALREARSARWANVSLRMPRATFSGRIVEPDPESPGPYYRYNLIERQVYFSAFHLRPDTAPLYVEALWRHHTQWLKGYAVSFYLLAKFMLEQGLKAPPLKALITTSEKVTPEMRAVMEKAYACRVYEEYGTVENALFASEDIDGRLRVSPDAGLVEILRPDGTPCNPGEVGEVVTTCLFRTYQPFIRYRLGDLACWEEDASPGEEAMPVLKEVTGRLEDVITGPDGRQMVRFHGIFVDQPHVQEGQIIQESLEHIRVKVIPAEGFGEEDIEEIRDRIHQRLGHTIRVTVESVDHIPRTASGKFQAVISRIPADEESRT